MMKSAMVLAGVGVFMMGTQQPLVAQSNARVQSTAAKSVAERDKAALEKLNSDWLNAYRTRDRATLDRILADDFAAVYPDDRMLSKADLIAAATGTGRTVETVSWDRLRIMVFEDVAIVTARSRLTGLAAGKPFIASNDYADIYAKRGGRWRAISAHVVRAAATQ